MVIIDVTTVIAIVSVIIGVIGVAFGGLSWIAGRKGNKDAKKVAEEQEQLMKKQTQSQLFAEYCRRNQEIKNQLIDPTKKLISRQQFIELCMDEYVSKMQGDLSEEEWDVLSKKMLDAFNNDNDFLIVWKGYSPSCSIEFRSFFNNTIIRKVFPNEFNTKI